MFVFAVARLGLAPADFWALSVAEWRALVLALAPRGVMGRADLDALIKQYKEQ